MGVLLDPELAVGEAYMDGTFVIEQGSIADFLDLAMSQDHSGKPPCWVRLQWLAALSLASARAIQSARRARAGTSRITTISTSGSIRSSSTPTGNIAAPISSIPTQSLDDAQLAKKRHIAAKLLVDARRSACSTSARGWGGLALYLAEICGARVTGITLSEEQFALARERARREGPRRPRRVPPPGLSRRRRSVSTASCRSACSSMSASASTMCSSANAPMLLADDGVMLLHSIGRSEGPGITNPWIDKYIFPGGYIPALSEVLPAVERAGFLVTDIEILRLHYAETLKHWRERFLAHREDLLKIYDERFVRMWEFYLAASEMAFREQGMMVFQLQLDETARCGSHHARLHRARGSAPARTGKRQPPAAAACGE